MGRVSRARGKCHVDLCHMLIGGSAAGSRPVSNESKVPVQDHNHVIPAFAENPVIGILSWHFENLREISASG